MLEETNLYPRRTQTSGFHIERWEMLQRDLTQSPAPSTGELQHVCHGIDRRKVIIGDDSLELFPECVNVQTQRRLV